MCGDGIDCKALLSSLPSLSQTANLTFQGANCEWHPRRRASGRVLVIIIDLPVRKRRSIFPRLAP